MTVHTTHIPANIIGRATPSTTIWVDPHSTIRKSTTGPLRPERRAGSPTCHSRRSPHRRAGGVVIQVVPYRCPMLEGGQVVIISGPPGSGKTTVADAIVSGCELGVHLESDVFYRSIRSGFVAPHLPDAHHQNTAVMDVVTDAAAAYAEAGYAVVWDGVVGPWFLDRVARRLAARRLPLRYLVVRPDREVALDRVRKRDGVTETSGAEIMYGQFAALGEFESHVVESNRPIADVIGACRAALTGDSLMVSSDAWIDDRWPISVKAVLGWDDRFVVLRNRRDEWELPGGRLDATDAGPEETLRREINEELGLDAVVGPMIDSWIYEVEGRRVLILTYECEADRPPEFDHSDEHTDVGLHTIAELEAEVIPSGYLRSIRRVGRR